MPGVLLSQWSLSEWEGALRVASTEQPVWWGGPRTESETTVTTLGQRGDALVRLGRVGGLGKGERVYAVRFIGDVGYVVTFRQVDPLYTLDLSAPSQPVVRGELKIRGYSAYLHPVGDDLLLGIGQDADDDGRVVGAQASLFDVSDLRTRRGSTRSPSARAGRRRRASTTRSSGGRVRGSPSFRSRSTRTGRSSARSGFASGAPAGSPRPAACRIPPLPGRTRSARRAHRFGAPWWSVTCSTPSPPPA